MIEPSSRLDFKYSPHSAGSAQRGLDAAFALRAMAHQAVHEPGGGAVLPVRFGRAEAVELREWNWNEVLGS